MAVVKATPTTLDGVNDAKKGLEMLVKKYGEATAVQMLQRGEYDVLYRAGRRDVVSAQRKEQKARLDRLETELARRDKMIEELNAKLKK